VKLTAWRITKRKYAARAFTGEGARRFGGRWNSKGTVVVYTAGSCSLSALEMLVHLESHQILEAYAVAEVTFDSRLMQTIDHGKLPKDWRAEPAPIQLKAIGDRWIAEGLCAVLRVPSVIIETEFNYLLNPNHHDFRKIVIGPNRSFSFDPRLAK
jgi:RES domain-containing protein